MVKAATVIGWHRKGFRLFWAWKVHHGKTGGPTVPKEVRALIRTMSRQNHCGVLRAFMANCLSSVSTSVRRA
jgi:hypothetical protein